jgi:hypothetical protein
LRREPQQQHQRILGKEVKKHDDEKVHDADSESNAEVNTNTKASSRSSQNLMCSRRLVTTVSLASGNRKDLTEILVTADAERAKEETQVAAKRVSVANKEQRFGGEIGGAVTDLWPRKWPRLGRLRLLLLSSLRRLRRLSRRHACVEHQNAAKHWPL